MTGEQITISNTARWFRPMPLRRCEISMPSSLALSAIQSARPRYPKRFASADSPPLRSIRQRTPGDSLSRRQFAVQRREAGDIDMVVVRENTEGEYAQVGGFVHQTHPAEVAVQTSVFTRHGVERIIRYAFELATKRKKKNLVTSITKSNAQGFSMVLWDNVFQSVAAEFPQIKTESLLVDAAAMNFVRRPQSFDVVVATNLFGDILSDISAIVSGSIGLAASANIDPTYRYPSMFEPVHGSAPDIAGKGIANPLAAIVSAAMMLDHLGLPGAAQKMNTALESVLWGEKIRTP